MPDLTAKKKRPLWYNLSPLNLPLPGLVSILHRVSGVVLFLGLIAFLYLLDLSLASESGYAQAVGLLRVAAFGSEDRKSTRLKSSHLVISYAVFCLKKKKQHRFQNTVS